MWSWTTNKYGGRAALQSLSDILIHGDSGNISHGSQSSDLRRMFFRVARAQDVLEEIFNEIWPLARNNISFTMDDNENL